MGLPFFDGSQLLYPSDPGYPDKDAKKVEAAPAAPTPDTFKEIGEQNSSIDETADTLSAATPGKGKKVAI